MIVKEIQKEINRLKWYANVAEKIPDLPWFADVDRETCDIIMDMAEDMASIANTMELLLDNADIKLL